MSKQSRRLKVGSVEYIVNYEKEAPETETGFPGAIIVDEIFWIYEEDGVNGTKTHDVTALMHAIASDVVVQMEELLA